MTALSVCIATRDRPELLAATLDALARQGRPADEVVVVDGSRGGATAALLAGLPGVSRLQADTTALPHLRRMGWQAAQGGLILFLDDDILLHADALASLVGTWEALAAGGNRPAGIGFLKVWDDGRTPQRQAGALRERWLGTAGLAPGTLTRGGLSITHAGLAGTTPVRVEHLWGGAMAFPRAVLERIGPLANLESLYEAGIGRGEDVVLSRQAARFGPLYLLTQPLARHRRTLGAEPRPYASSGWRMGLTATWGRAHTLRWVAREPVFAFRDWCRIVSLEFARSLWGIARAPWRGGTWSRAGGALVGAGRSLRQWRTLPPGPSTAADDGAG